MNRRSRITIALATLTFALAPLGASAALTNIVAPKLLVKGTASASIVGKGRVIIQVLVNPDGSHRATHVIHSTNPGDNQAAMQIAQSSTYRPARRNGKPTIWFYDYTLVFTGSSVSAADMVTGNSPAAQIQRMVRIGNYAGAKTRASNYLLSNPGDSKVRSLLGVADFYANDYPGSAAAFSRAGTVDAKYKAVAAHAFSSAAVSLAVSDPATAVGYGQKALALDGGANSLFALGVAQLGAKDSASAVTNLKKARQLAFADPRIDAKSKLNLDTALFQAYAAQNDLQDEQTIGAEIKQLDPTSTLAARIQGNQYLNAAFADLTANKNDDAVANFDLAAQNGDSQVQVTAYAQASLALANEQKPDYNKVKAYADKALAVKSDDALANFAEGVALTGQWATNHKDDVKKQAIAACTKAEQSATAEGNNALLFKIESFVKTNLS
jgi:hypothetical protein